MHFFQKMNCCGTLYSLKIDNRVVEYPKMTKDKAFVYFCKEAGLEIAKKSKESITLANGEVFNFKDTNSTEKQIKFLARNSTSKISFDCAIERLKRLKSLVNQIHEAGFTLKELKNLIPYKCELQTASNFWFLQVRDADGFLVYFNNHNINFIDAEFIKNFVETLQKELKFFETWNFSYTAWDTLIRNAFRAGEFGERQLSPSEMYQKEKQFYDTYDLRYLIENKLAEIKENISFEWDSEKGYFVKGENFEYSLSRDYYQAFENFYKKEILSDSKAKRAFDLEMEKLKQVKWRAI